MSTTISNLPFRTADDARELMLPGGPEDEHREVLRAAIDASAEEAQRLATATAKLTDEERCERREVSALEHAVQHVHAQIPQRMIQSAASQATRVGGIGMALVAFAAAIAWVMTRGAES